MRDKLKEFIVKHRAEFDSAVPPDLWASIGATVEKNRHVKFKKITNMLKYGFGASAIAIGTWVVLQTSSGQPVSVQPVTSALPVIINDSVKTDSRPEESPWISVAKDQTTQSVEHLKSSPPVCQDSTAPSAVLQEVIADSSYPETTLAAITPDQLLGPTGTNLNLPSKNDSNKTEHYTWIDTIFNGVSALKVVSANCRVTICSGKGTEVLLSGKVGGAAGNIVCLGTRSYMNKVSVCRFEKEDSLLTVWIEPKPLPKRIKISKEDKQESYLNFVVPKWLEVDVKNSSGNIVLSGIESPRVNLKNNFGHIHVNNTKTELSLVSGSGNMVVKNHKGILTTNSSFGHQVLEDVEADLHLKSGSGNITVKNVTGPIDLNSSFGNQHLEDIRGDIKTNVSSGALVAKQIKGNIHARSSFGKQRYTAVEGNIQAVASSGNIVIDGFTGVLGIGTSFGNISGKAITLRGSSEFKTSSGNIHMEITNDVQDLRFDLSASSGHMLVEKGQIKNSSDRSLLFGEGKIVVKGVTSFGNQTYH